MNSGFGCGQNVFSISPVWKLHFPRLSFIGNSGGLTFEKQHLTERKSLVMEACSASGAVPKWIRRSYEQLHQHSTSSARVTCKINPYISQSTGNLASNSSDRRRSETQEKPCDKILLLEQQQQSYEKTSSSPRCVRINLQKKYTIWFVPTTVKLVILHTGRIKISVKKKFFEHEWKSAKKRKGAPKNALKCQLTLVL